MIAWADYKPAPIPAGQWSGGRVVPPYWDNEAATAA